jgi:hypothetical protein
MRTLIPLCLATQGVAIETRGFTFVTSGKKRETLTGEATVSASILWVGPHALDLQGVPDLIHPSHHQMRFFDYLGDFRKFDGILPNLFTGENGAAFLFPFAAGHALRADIKGVACPRRHFLNRLPVVACPQRSRRPRRRTSSART